MGGSGNGDLAADGPWRGPWRVISTAAPGVKAHLCFLTPSNCRSSRRMRWASCQPTGQLGEAGPSGAQAEPQPSGSRGVLAPFHFWRARTLGVRSPGALTAPAPQGDCLGGQIQHGKEGTPFQERETPGGSSGRDPQAEHATPSAHTECAAITRTGMDETSASRPEIFTARPSDG